MSINPCPTGTSDYYIKAGDTIYLIAQRFGITPTAIMDINPGLNIYNLQIGQRICIPFPSETCLGGNGFIHTINPGDTFYNLSIYYGVSVQDIIVANPDVDPARLIVGQKICIPKPSIPIQLPCCLLLDPKHSNLPPEFESADPIAGIIVKQVSSNTCSYSVVASAMPPPGSLGNYNLYLTEIWTPSTRSEEPSNMIQLNFSDVANQYPIWAGGLTLSSFPSTKDNASIFPFNSYTGKMGPDILYNTFAQCHS